MVSKNADAWSCRTRTKTDEMQFRQNAEIILRL